MIARAGAGPRALPGWVWRWGALLAALALWEAAGQATAGRFLIAGPSEIADYLWTNAGLVGRALAVTLQAATAGFLLGNLAAMALACVALLVPRMAWLISALALLVFCLPLVATGPILRVLYGAGTGPQITLAALAVYYTTYLPLLVGLRAAPASWFDLVHTYGQGRMAELLRIRIHAAVPYLVSGLQIAAPAAFLGAMVGEFTGAERGMGVLTIRAIGALDVPGTWALATVASGVSIMSYLALGALGRRLGTHPRDLLLAPPQATRRPPAARRALGRLGRAVGLIIVVLLLWQGLMEGFGLNPFFAKRPADVWAFLVTVPEAAANRALLLGAFAQTMVLAVPGYLAGLALGAMLAAGVVLVPGLGAAVLPVAIALRSVPIVTTAPLLVLALGRGATGTITIVAVMIFFPTLVACLTGLRQTPGQVMDLFATYAAPRRQRLLLAQVPAMLPAFFAAARMAVPAALLAATTAEWLATGIGMGSLMALTASTSSYAMLWAAIVLLASTAMLAYAGVELLERRVLRVYASEQRQP
ncbi:ABC transporter permease subunit [Fertoebacter nigrum]|uniref:ABC transporter permease subunit n=1 Tax=Fertoeibacter niger TaxID=2656921 RepID=A0A8X8H0U0_9RHOB|nr:ABC transporter permease subunit [Fertoeibacter niger]NUB45463.1 ABC transporter permease subunit [Fertoeibacter niger]